MPRPRDVAGGAAPHGLARERVEPRLGPSQTPRSRFDALSLLRELRQEILQTRQKPLG